MVEGDRNFFPFADGVSFRQENVEEEGNGAWLGTAAGADIGGRDVWIRWLVAWSVIGGMVGLSVRR